MFEYVIQGTPTPLHRPRFSKGHVYNDQKNKMFLDYLDIKRQHAKQPFFAEPIHMQVVFTFGIPTYFSRLRAQQVIDQPFVGKSDLDNLLKYVMDVCTGALYTNDNIVTSISAKKIYGLHSKTVFSFHKL